MSENKLSPNLKSFIAIMFVASGATGLVYQVVWFKYLAIFLGSTTYAQMIVLSAFLGGLAMGNHFAGKRADALKNPLLIYSILEFFIGVYCFFYPILSRTAGDVFIATAQAGDMTSTDGVLFLMVRALLSVSLLLLPTMAMGATLPVLSKAFVDDLKTSQRDMGILYGLNSMGAVLGVLLSGFYFIRYFGLDVSLYISASVNILLGVTGGIVALKMNGTSPEVEVTPSPEIENLPENQTVDKKTLRLIILIAGTSGFAALLYEMVWVRLLIHIFGSSTYAFSVMLMAFISGITLGSMIASSQFFKNLNKIRVVAFSQAAIALSTVPVLLLYERMIYYFWVTASLFVKTDTTFDIYLFLQFAACFGSIMIPTIFMGITLPVIVSIVAGQKHIIGASVGKVFSVNTVGTVLGSVLTGLVFIPLLGMRGTFELGIFVNLTGAGLLYYFAQQKSKAHRLGIAGALAVTFILILTLTPDWNVKLSMASVFRRLSVEPPRDYKEFTDIMNQRDVLYYKEGINANVSVVTYHDSSRTKALIINGKADASNGGDMVTQVLLGQIPMLLHENPKDVFVVGLGSGVTVGSVLTHPVNEVVCVEIAKEVAVAAEFFKKENNDCLHNPKLKMLYEDAHTYLKLTPKKFDIIVSEPSNPWIAGIGNLFSLEYFELCRTKLKQGGIMVQWFHIYELDDDILRLVMNTFSTVFPYSQMWNSASGDIIMVGTETDMGINAKRLNEKFNTPAVLENLRRVKLNDPFTFLSTQILAPTGFYAVSEYKEINSELHPLLEFRAPRSLFKAKNATILFEEDDRFRPSTSNLLIERYIQKYPPTNEQLLTAMRFHYKATQTYRLVYALAKHAIENNPLDYDAAQFLMLSTEQLQVHKVRTAIVNGFAQKFGDTEHWKSIYFYDKINEEILGTSYLGHAAIDRYVDTLLAIANKDSASQVKRFAEIANAYFQNDQLDQAYNYAAKVQHLMNTSPHLSSQFRIEEFIHTAAMSSAYMGNYKLAIDYLIALIGNNTDYKRKDYLMRMVERMIKGESS